MNSYSGIGSRNITTKESKRISLVSDYLFNLGYVLYSGHADGSDISFEQNCQGLGVSFVPGINIIVLLSLWVLLGIAGIVNFFESKTYQNFYNWFICGKK